MSQEFWRTAFRFACEALFFAVLLGYQPWSFPSNASELLFLEHQSAGCRKTGAFTPKD